MKWIFPLFLSLSSCIGRGYYTRKIKETRDLTYEETMTWAQEVRDGQMTIYEMIRALKDRRFTR